MALWPLPALRALSHSGGAVTLLLQLPTRIHLDIGVTLLVDLLNRVLVLVPAEVLVAVLVLVEPEGGA